MKRVCIRCRKDSIPGTSRCPDHTRAWVKRTDTQAAYIDPEYQRNRALILASSPACHWRMRGCTGRATTADHVVPVAEGGTGTLANLVPACATCNRLRGASLGGRRRAQQFL